MALKISIIIELNVYFIGILTVNLAFQVMKNQKMEYWHPGITLIKEYFCYDYYKKRQDWMNLIPFIVGVKKQLFKVAHLQLSQQLLRARDEAKLS